MTGIQYFTEHLARDRRHQRLADGRAHRQRRRLTTARPVERHQSPIRGLRSLPARSARAS